MQTVNIHEAKTQLSKLVARANAGETIIVAKSGKPQARLVPLEDKPEPMKREFGWLRGKYTVPEDFDTMFQKEIEEMFDGDADRGK